MRSKVMKEHPDFRRFPRDPDEGRVLPRDARAYVESLLLDPKRLREFVHGLGIWTKAGRLTRNYRCDENQPSRGTDAKTQIKHAQGSKGGRKRTPG